MNQIGVSSAAMEWCWTHFENMRRMLKIAVVGAAMMLPLAMNAQDKVEAMVGADLVSSYIWRGQDLGSAAVQPTLGIAYKGFSAEAWGCYGIADPDDTKEFDLTLMYQTGGFSIGVVDYFYMGNIDDDRSDKFFMYEAHRTVHEFEAMVGYDFGVLSASWSTIFAGNDGVTRSGKRAYSSYFELAAPFKLGGLEWEAAVGATPFVTSYYDVAKGFAVINTSLKATKEIKITPTFSVPMYGVLAANPSAGKLYLTVGVSF